MKKTNFIIRITIAAIVILFSNKLNAQWLLGGNPQFGAGVGTSTVSNVYGTVALNTDNLIFGTGGTPR